MTELPTDLLALAKDVLVAAKAANLRIATAESCTGGLVSGCLTAIPGSSAVIDSGFITYSNEAKIRLLGVPRDAIAEHGAVSDVVAAAMAEGALAQTDQDAMVKRYVFAGTRTDIRRASVAAALELLLGRLKSA